MSEIKMSTKNVRLACLLIASFLAYFSFANAIQPSLQKLVMAQGGPAISDSPDSLQLKTDIQLQIDSDTSAYGQILQNIKKNNTDLRLKPQSPQIPDIYIPVKLLKKNIVFEKQLTLQEYLKKIKELITKKNPNIFNNKLVAKYYFRALAENIYSLHGTLEVSVFNSIEQGRKTYYEIKKSIDELQTSPKLKRELKKLYAISCIYIRKVDSAGPSLKKINKIPSNAVLYVIPKEEKEYQQTIVPVKKKDDKNADADAEKMGEYVGTEKGENLYYICASYYPEFAKLPKQEQIKILDEIYSYNPTLMVAPSLDYDYSTYDLIRNWLFPPPKPQALKYCLRPNIGWLILPAKLPEPNNTSKTQL